ncbi:MAG: TetR family transcriptional regulator [Alphaproteobacteria bacterium]
MVTKPKARKATVRKADVPRHIVATALELAATQGWRDTTLADIAAAARLSLAEVNGVFRSKEAILAAFVRGIDAQVLAGDEPELADQPPRDRLFDVIMRRFDALAPHKEAVRAIVRDSLCDPLAALCGACSLGQSMAWMLEAARIDSAGLCGLVRIKGLAAVYLSALRVWLNDDSEDMARTMAALDKRLRQAESLVMLCRLPRRRRRAPEAEPA